MTTAHRVAWVVVKGLPWLAYRSRDLGPVIVEGLVAEVFRRPGRGAPRG